MSVASASLSRAPFDFLISVGPKPSSSQHSRIGFATTPLHVTAATSSANSKIKTNRPKQDDDYHATLKALNSKGRFPRKSLGQHYMLNGSINEQLAEAADVKEGDVVLEIGPGTGSLTNVLVNAGATVLAIEKDPYMAALVTERFANTNLVEVVEEDFTRCHIRSHLSSILDTRSSVDVNSQLAKVVANIPFNISTDVLKQLLPMGDMISEVVLLLQEEAALRLVDPSLRSTEYRPINIFINFYSDPEYKFKVPRSNFFPQPKVDAAVVAFRLKQPLEYPQVSSTKSFFSMVNSAFNGKRKMLRKSLQHICSSPETEAALSEIGLPATISYNYAVKARGALFRRLCKTSQLDSENIEPPKWIRLDMLRNCCFFNKKENVEKHHIRRYGAPPQFIALCVKRNQLLQQV